MLVDASLVLLGPAFVGRAVPAVGTLRTELTHDERLPPWRLPLHAVGVFGSAPIPAEILVQAEDVQRFAKRVAEDAGVRTGLVHVVQRGCDQASGIELTRRIGQFPQE